MDTKILLSEKEMPQQWYNIQADLPKPLPPVLHPGTKQAARPADLAPLFPMELIMQEVSQERYIDIPEEVQKIYKHVAADAALPGAPRWKKPWTPRPRSTTNTKASARPAATSPTPPSPRPTTTRRRASRASPPRPAPGSGAARWPSPATCSVWNARSTWSK